MSKTAVVKINLPDNLDNNREKNFHKDPGTTNKGRPKTVVVKTSHLGNPANRDLINFY